MLIIGRYQEVPRADYGLEIGELLALPDKELNQVCFHDVWQHRPVHAIPAIDLNIELHIHNQLQVCPGNFTGMHNLVPAAVSSWTCACICLWYAWSECHNAAQAPA